MSEALLHNPLNNREQLGSLSLSVFLIKLIRNKFFTIHLRVLFRAARSVAFRGAVTMFLSKCVSILLLCVLYDLSLRQNKE